MWTFCRTLSLLLPFMFLPNTEPLPLQTREETKCEVPSAEAAMDDLVEQAKSQLEHPLNLPNKDGLINLAAGELWGLNTLNRSGPIWISCNSSTVTMHFPLSATKPLRVRYEWDKKVPSRSIKGVAYARTNSLDVTVTVQVQRMPPDSVMPPLVQVTDLEIQNMGEVEVNVSGLSHVTWLSARAIAFMTNVFENAVTRSLQDGLKESMNDVLQRTSSTEMQLL